MVSEVYSLQPTELIAPTVKKDFELTGYRAYRFNRANR